MQRRAVQFNRFNSGITTNLRENTESPMLARSWNFDAHSDRLIQHYGLSEVTDTVGHLVEYEPRTTTNIDDWYLRRGGMLHVAEDLTTTYFNLSCNPNPQTFSLGSGDLQMSVPPYFYNDHVVFQKDNKTLWVKDLTNLVAPEVQILTNLTTDEVDDNTYFLEHSQDDRLYIFSDRFVHYLDIAESGVGSGNNPYAQYQPITDFTRLGDIDGRPGTYTGFLGPFTQTVTQIAQMQSLLILMGYYTGSVDGIYGPLTEAAVIAFQTNNVATGGVQGGQAAGDPLFIDGIVGPETSSAMSQYSQNVTGAGSLTKVLTFPDKITAVGEYGGYIAIATQDKKGNAVVYFWNRELDANGDGWFGVDTLVNVGQGIVQVLNVVDGVLMAIMTPASIGSCAHRYDRLSIYGIDANFQRLPHARAVLLREYNLRISGYDDANFLTHRYNKVHQKSIVRGSRLYFSARLHFQHHTNEEDDPGAMAGIYSIDSRGNLFPEVFYSTEDDDFPYTEVFSFGLYDSAFVWSSDGFTGLNDVEATDNVSGLVTTIINAGAPYANKQLDNVYLSLHNAGDLDKIEVWIREVEDVDDGDAGWQLAYSGDTTENKFSQRVVINRMENGDRFAQFRELQIMVKLFGIGAEVTNLTATYNLLDINE